MKRIAVATLLLFAPACEAILGLHDRTLADAGGADVAIDATTCDGDFCSCNPHAFCDDFDPYSSVQDLQGHWSVPGFSSPIFQLGGTVAIDNGTNVLPPTLPNALLTTVTLPIALQGAGFVMTQVDAQAPNVAGVKMDVRFRIIGIDPADGAAPILDSGVALFGGILEIADLTSKNGVGIALSEQGGYVGYALDLLTPGARLAQGKTFMSDSPNTLKQLAQYVQLEVTVAKRSTVKLPVDCTPGPVLTDVDGGPPDAAIPTDPIVVLVTTPLTPPVCEVLSGPLALPDWLLSPVVILGSVAKGQGVFSVEFDNFTLDFVTQ